MNRAERGRYLGRAVAAVIAGVTAARGPATAPDPAIVRPDMKPPLLDASFVRGSFRPGELVSFGPTAPADSIHLED